MPMMRLIRILSCGIVLLLSACHHAGRYKDHFYNGDMSDAFKRLPLVEPYEAIKAGSWAIEFHTSHSSLGADSIFVDADRFIIGYGNNGTTVVGDQTVPYLIYFVVDLKQKKELRFYDSTGFINELKKHGFSWSNLIPTDRVYSEYRKTGLLPWRSSP